MGIWKPNENLFLKNKYTKRQVEERLSSLKCVKDIINLKTQPEIDLERTIGLTNGHEQK